MIKAGDGGVNTAAKRIDRRGIGEVRVQARPGRAVVGCVQVAAAFAADDDLALAGGDAEHFSKGHQTTREGNGKIIRGHTGIDIVRHIAVTVVGAAVGVAGKPGTRPDGAVGRVAEIANGGGVGIGFAGDGRGLPDLVRGVPPVKNRQRVQDRAIDKVKAVRVIGHRCAGQQQGALRGHDQVFGRIAVGVGVSIPRGKSVHGQRIEISIGQGSFINAVQQRGIKKIRAVAGKLKTEGRVGLGVIDMHLRPMAPLVGASARQA